MRQCLSERHGGRSHFPNPVGDGYGHLSNYHDSHLHWRSGQLLADQHRRWRGSVDADPRRVGFYHRSDQLERGLGDRSSRRRNSSTDTGSRGGSPLTTGTAPYAVATGDFNGDGFTDFAVENYTSGTVSVFLGNGDGTFKPQVTYAVGSPAGAYRRSRCKRRWKTGSHGRQHWRAALSAFCSAMATVPSRPRSHMRRMWNRLAWWSPISIMTASPTSLPPISKPPT